VQARLEMAAF